MLKITFQSFADNIHSECTYLFISNASRFAAWGDG